MGEIKRTIEEEAALRYRTAFDVLANRCLGEPYNFHRVTPLLSQGLLANREPGAAIVAECARQYASNGNFSPQSVAIALGIDNVTAVNRSRTDTEITLPEAMEALLTYHGQFCELQIAKYVEGWVMQGKASEEIQVEAAQARKDMGLFARLSSSDGVAEFEKRLLAAIDGLVYSYPVTPHLAKLRTLLPHYEPGDYIVVQALSGVGKTYEALSQIYHTSICGIPCTCINLENTPENMQKRVWQMHSNEYFRPDLRGTDIQMQHYLRKWDEVKKMPFKSYNPGPTLPAILSTIRQDWQDRGTQFVVVDYAQLISIPGYRGGRNYELGEISAAFRALALELQIPIMVLAQTKQEVDKRSDKRAGLYDIKDCANFSQDATICASLYRPGYFNIRQDEMGNEYDPNHAEIIIVKGRESGTAVAECRFSHIKGFYDIPTSQPSPNYPPPIDISTARPKADEEVPF